MAVTYIDHAGTQGQTDFSFTFPYLEDEHIKVEIAGVETTDFTVVATPTSKIVLDTGLSAAASVRVRRRSAPNENLVDFVNGSVLTESELDLSYRHNRYLAEEIAELNDTSLQIEAGGTEWDAKTKRIKNVATAVDSTDAVTKVYLDNKVAQVSTGASHPPLKWVFSATSGTNNTYTVTGAEVNGDTAYEVSIDGLIKEPTVEYTVDPSTDTLTIIPNMTGSEDIVVIQRGFGVAIAGTVGTNSLVDGSVTNPKLAAGAVTSDKISTTDTNFNVQSDGKVGIGTASPNLKLDISTNNENGLKLINPDVSPVDNSNNLPAILFQAKGWEATTGSRTYSARIRVNSNYSSAPDRGNTHPVMNFDLETNEDDPDDNLTTKMMINADGNVGIGTTTPAHTLDVTGDLNITGNYKVNGTNLHTVPTGTVSAFAGSAAPTGYLKCDGDPYNRTTYAALFDVIGTTYGAGNGSTTFNIPNLQGRVVAGIGESLLGTTADVLGEHNGLIADTKTHTLTEAEMPSHTRTSGYSVHTGTIQFPGVIGSGNKLVSSATTSTGGGQAHNNVQPTIILNYIIKY